MVCSFAKANEPWGQLAIFNATGAMSTSRRCSEIFVLAACLLFLISLNPVLRNLVMRCNAKFGLNITGDEVVALCRNRRGFRPHISAKALCTEDVRSAHARMLEYRAMFVSTFTRRVAET